MKSLVVLPRLSPRQSTLPHIPSLPHLLLYLLVSLGRLLQVDLINWVSNVRLHVRLSVHFNEIWYVGRGFKGYLLPHL